MQANAKRPPLLGAISLSMLVIAVVGCGTTSNDTRSATVGLPNVRQELVAQRWRLDATASSLTPRIVGQVTLSFTENSSITGQAPCNRYRGSYRIKKQKVTISAVVHPGNACNAMTMTAQDAYLRALQATHEVDTTHRNALTLTSPDGTKLVFRAQDREAALEGTWAIARLVQGGKPIALVEGTRPTVRFGIDHSVVVRSECNTITTTWTLDGPAIRFGRPTMGTKSCVRPAGIMNQERAIATALAQAVVVDVNGANLVLSDKEGSTVLVATRQSVH